MPRVHHLRAARMQVRHARGARMYRSHCKVVSDGMRGRGGRCWAGQGLERPDPFVPWLGPAARCGRRCAAALRRVRRVAASRMPPHRADSARASCAAGTEAGRGPRRRPRARRPSSIIIQYGQKRREHRRRAARPPARRAAGGAPHGARSCCRRRRWRAEGVRRAKARWHGAEVGWAVTSIAPAGLGVPEVACGGRGADRHGLASRGG